MSSSSTFSVSLCDLATSPSSPGSYFHYKTMECESLSAGSQFWSASLLMCSGQQTLPQAPSAPPTSADKQGQDLPEIS